VCAKMLKKGVSKGKKKTSFGAGNSGGWQDERGDGTGVSTGKKGGGGNFPKKKDATKNNIIITRMMSGGACQSWLGN